MRIPAPIALGFFILLTILTLGCGGGDGVSEAEVITREGLAFVNQHNFETAIERFDQALILAPNFVPALINRGYTYDKLGQYERAIEDYNEAIKLDSENAKAYNNRGFAYRDLGQYSLALADYDEAIRLNQFYADAYSSRALVNAFLGNDTQADEDFDRAVELGIDPNGLKAELDHAKNLVAIPAVNLTGTSWHFEDLDYLLNYQLEFLDDGRLRLFNSPDKTPDNDSWEQEAGNIRIYYNDNFSTLEGTLSGNTMSGTSSNIIGQSFVWRASRIIE